MKTPKQQDNEAIGCMAVILIVGALSILAGIYTAPV